MDRSPMRGRIPKLVTLVEHQIRDGMLTDEPTASLYRTFKWDVTRMSSASHKGSVSDGLPLRRLRQFKSFGAYAIWVMCSASIILGMTSMRVESAQSPVPQSPMESMKSTVHHALEVLRDPELKKPDRADERVTRLKKIADSRFDYGEMAKRSLGSQWSKLEERQQQEFVDLFTEFLTSTYMDKIHDYGGEDVKFLNERIEDQYAEVKSLMVGKKTEIPLDYRLLLKDGEWKAYDVVVDGISLVRNYREQFTTILRSSSYDKLARMLREKNTQYTAKIKNGEPRTSSR